MAEEPAASPATPDTGTPAAAPAAPAAAPATPDTGTPAAAPAVPAAAPATPDTGSWRDSLPDDIRADQALAKFETPADLAREHVNLQGLIGRKGVIVPDEKATPEDWGKFYDQIGRPESADKYDFGDFTPPENLPWNENVQKEMQGSFHKHGLNNEQARGVIADYAEFQDAQYQAYLAEGTQQVAAVTSEWGAKAEDNLAEAKLAAETYFPGDGLDRAEKLLGQSGEFLKAMQRIGADLTENGVPRSGRSQFGAVTPEAAKTELTKLNADARADKAHPLNDKHHPEHKAVVARREQLYEIANPGEAGVA